MLVLLAFVAAFVIYNIQQKNMILPVFSVIEAPVVLSKGQDGATLIVELSFLDEQFPELLPLLQEKQALLLVDTDLAARFPAFSKQLVDKQIAVGLYSDEVIETTEQLQKEIDTFINIFQTKPLYYTHATYAFTDDILHYLYKEQINVLAPTSIYEEKQTTLTEGAFIFVPLHVDHQYKFEELQAFVKAQSFLSIEENIFQYRLKFKRSP